MIEALRAARTTSDLDETSEVRVCCLCAQNERGVSIPASRDVPKDLYFGRRCSSSISRPSNLSKPCITTLPPVTNRIPPYLQDPSQPNQHNHIRPSNPPSSLVLALSATQIDTATSFRGPRSVTGCSPASWSLEGVGVVDILRRGPEVAMRLRGADALGVYAPEICVTCNRSP